MRTNFNCPSGPGARRKFGKRATQRNIAVNPILAQGAPKHRWLPQPKWMYFSSGRSILTLLGSGNISGDTFAAVCVNNHAEGRYQIKENDVARLAVHLFTSIIHDSILCDDAIQLGRNRRETAPFHYVSCQFLLRIIVVKFR